MLSRRACDTVVREAIVVLLAALISLAGVERGLISVASAAAGTGSSIGLICHALTKANGDDPAGETRHDCCDECAVAAPAVLPSPPAFALPARITAPVAHAAPVVAVATRFIRTPRLSQGPPSA
jgi:hypothetical protein